MLKAQELELAQVQGQLKYHGKKMQPPQNLMG